MVHFSGPGKKALAALLLASSLGLTGSFHAWADETDGPETDGGAEVEAPEHPENTGKHVSEAAHAMQDLDPAERADAAHGLRDIARAHLPDAAMERPEHPEHPERPEHPEHPETPERPDHPETPGRS